MKIRINPSPEIHQEINLVLPDRAYLESVWGEINRFNIKTMPDGSQWVIDSLSGEALSREKAKFFQDRKGNILWTPVYHEQSIFDRPVLYKWKNPEK